MARHMNPSSSTNKTIDAIDRKRERERRFMLRKARDNAAELSTALVQRLLDQHIIETNSDQAIREVMEKQLGAMSDMEEFDMQFKIAPLRTLTQDPNIISLFITQLSSTFSTLTNAITLYFIRFLYLFKRFSFMSVLPTSF